MSRTSDKRTRPDSKFIALEQIAAQTGLTVEEVRCGGATLFAHLAAREGDLTSAIVAACAASGVRPHRMIKLLPSFSVALEQGKSLQGQKPEQTKGKDAK